MVLRYHPAWCALPGLSTKTRIRCGIVQLEYEVTFWILRNRSRSSKVWEAGGARLQLDIEGVYSKGAVLQGLFFSWTEHSDVKLTRA